MADWHDDFRLGPWTVSPQLCRISTADQSVHVKNKSMAVLVRLADAGGDVVTRDEILDAVWPGMAVTDDVLTQSIVELRKAFGDDAREPKFIETIPRVGVRLIPNVEKPEAPNTQKSWRIPVAIAFVALAIIVWFAMEFGDGGRSPVIAVKESPSIAVLPFVPLSDNTSDRYLAEGMSDEIRTMLARIPGLKVINRTSSHVVMQTANDLREIGEKLGVRWLLEGTVRRSGNHVRIHVQLVNADDGSQSWSDRYDPDLADTAEIFAAQDAVAADVIEKLEVHVAAAPRRGLPTESIEAYTRFLEARAAVYDVDVVNAQTLLFEALKHDEGFAEAWELLAYVVWVAGGVQWEEIATQTLVQKFSRQANELDPELLFADVFVELSTVGFDYQSGGIELLEAAIKTEPNNPWLLEPLIWLIMTNGYVEETLAWTEHFLDVDPLSPYAHAYNIGALYALDRTDEALARLHDRRPTDAAIDIFQITMLGILLAEGMDDQAVDVLAFAVPGDSEFDRDWFLELAGGARNPESSVEFLDTRIEQLIATLPEDVAFAWQQTLPTLYLAFGHIDRFYELVRDEAPQDLHWEHAANLVWQGTVFRRTGFMEHSEYLDVTEKLGIHRTWEKRGAPDFCEKLDNQWRCR